jgi:hypothetical protein
MPCAYARSHTHDNMHEQRDPERERETVRLLLVEPGHRHDAQ